MGGDFDFGATFDVGLDEGFDEGGAGGFVEGDLFDFVLGDCGGEAAGEVVAVPVLAEADGVAFGDGVFVVAGGEGVFVADVGKGEDCGAFEEFAVDLKGGDAWFDG